MKNGKAKLVRVVHGVNEDQLLLVGKSIAAIKRSLREVFNIPYFAEAFVDGVPVDADHVIRQCHVVEFVKRFGFKGATNEPAEETEANGLLAVYDEPLRRMSDQVKAKGLAADEAVEAMRILVLQWCQHTFGSVAAWDLPELQGTITHLSKLLRVAGEVQRCDSTGVPGRKNSTSDIADFAYLHRSGDKALTWKEILTKWKKGNPTDSRVTKVEQIRDAYRRHYTDKAVR
jgi:hypothetical protein